MRIHVLQHIPIENEGAVSKWVENKRVNLTRTRFFAGDPLPAVRDVDCLLIMGGFMNVYDYERYPWLYHEKTFILDAIESGKRVLGVCLGAQLIADVLGARVKRSMDPEIGWFPVKMTQEARQNPLFRAFPDQFVALHWHEDTFDVPARGKRIAASEACMNQGFVIEDKVVGLQFHLEYTEHDLRAMVDFSRDGLVESSFVQRPKDLLAGGAYLEMLNNYLYAFLDDFLGGIGL